MNLILSLDGEKLDLKRQPLPKIPLELLALFDASELKKYMTEEELADLPAPVPAAAESESKEGN